MEKKIFDKRFVYFMWDDFLKDKECFVADNICQLQKFVESNTHNNVRHALSPVDDYSYPFVVDIDGEHSAVYRFAYYDPLYDVKWAWKNGGQVQARTVHSTLAWLDMECPDWSDKYEYRIKPKLSRMTYRELAEWLAKGHGQYRADSEATMSYPFFVYAFEDDTAEISEHYLVRRWGSDEWITPTVEVYEQDCKKE